MAADAHHRYRWLILVVGLAALIAGCAAQYGLAYLIPALRAGGLGLEQAGLLVSAPVLGVLSSLIAWGALADRSGERLVLTAGLGLAALLLAIVAVVEPGFGALWVLLFGVGAASAAVHAASGRLILGWFPPRRRGLAMGIRQMGQPLGIALAALVLPALAAGGLERAFWGLAAACAAATVLVVLIVRDPPVVSVGAGSAVSPAASPYREPFLWRLHIASGLLVIAQWTITVFAFDFLVTGLGWGLGSAGAVLAATQLTGAGVRLVAGAWSDRAGRRLPLMRRLAVAIGLVMLVLAVTAIAGSALAATALLVAAIFTLSPNGLAFTAVAERAGRAWAGRALGVQNTVQHATAGLAAPVLALVIAGAGGDAAAYGLAFGAVVVFPLIAAVVIPVGDETPAR